MPPIASASSPSHKSFTKKEDAKIREAICSIYNHVHVFYRGTLANSVDDMLNKIKTNPTFQENIPRLVNVKWTTVYCLLNHPDVRKRLDWLLTVG